MWLETFFRLEKKKGRFVCTFNRGSWKDWILVPIVLAGFFVSASAGLEAGWRERAGEVSSIVSSPDVIKEFFLI